MSIVDKNEFINAIWLHYIFFLPHAELVQLRKGFRQTLQVEQLVCLHGEIIRSMLVPTCAFNPTPKLLVGVTVTYSPESSNFRTTEEAIMLNWSDYICDCKKLGAYNYCDCLFCFF